MTDWKAVALRAKARKFAEAVKDCPGYAHKVPDEVIDSLDEEEIGPFIELLKSLGLRMQGLSLWEVDR